jgi:hypothetical protein
MARHRHQPLNLPGRRADTAPRGIRPELARRVSGRPAWTVAVGATACHAGRELDWEAVSSKPCHAVASATLSALSCQAATGLPVLKEQKW